MDILAMAKAEQDNLTAWRRHLHAHPEPSGQEEETVKFICSRLDEFGIAYVVVPKGGVIGFIGGVTGSVVSLVISFVLNNLTLIMAIFGGGGGNLSGIMNSIGYYGGGMGSAVSVVPPWLVLLALAFATVIGLVAGILPAARATKISALEAIRHE